MSHQIGLRSTMLSAQRRLLTIMVKFVIESQKMRPRVLIFLARQCHGDGSKTAKRPSMAQIGYPGCLIPANSASSKDEVGGF